MSIRIINADVMQGLAELPDESVHCIVTSPPYWRLRDYGADGQIGLEPTLAEHIAKLVEVFREVRRVLRKDGTLWLNYGDAYNAAGRVGHGRCVGHKQATNRASAAGADTSRPSVDTLKEKDLLMMPERLAIALQDDGWYVRSRIIWAKPNPMPESVTDRPTKSHEHIWLMSKQPRYFYDAAAIQEEGSGRTPGNVNPNGKGADNPRIANGGSGIFAAQQRAQETRNARDVWTIATAPFAEAHFATFPPELAERCIKAGCPQFTCSECGTALDHSIIETIRSSTNGNDMRQLRRAVSQAAVTQASDEVLLQEMRGCGTEASANLGAVQMVRNSGISGSPQEAAELLQQGMCISMDGEKQIHDEGEIHDQQRVCGSPHAATPGCEQGRIRDGAPSCDGADTRATAAQNGGCSPQEWGANGQRPRKPRSVGKGKARQAAESQNRESALPALQPANNAVPTCPCCAANLARVGAISPGTVLDVFGGSGTTGLVADRLQRNSILIELNPAYAAMARKRITSDCPLFTEAAE